MTDRFCVRLKQSRDLDANIVGAALQTMLDTRIEVAASLNGFARRHPREYNAAAEIFDVYHYIAETQPGADPSAIMDRAVEWIDLGFIVEGVQSWHEQGITIPAIARRLADADIEPDMDVRAVARQRGVDLEILAASVEEK